MARARNIIEWFAGGALALVVASPAGAMSSDLIAGSDTQGGLVRGTRIITVTSLDDDGAGSLRDAIAQTGPRVIIFDIGGVIVLKSDLRIHDPDVTIAGQTAPGPGITITGGSLRVRTHDVVIQHIAVRPGPSPSAKVNDNRDAISIDGTGKYASYSVRLENVTASWSVDETISTFVPTTRNITIRNSIVAEALRDAGHPKGDHSMGLLIGTDSRAVEVTGNLIASNAFRNPVIAPGATVFVANNYVVNPGSNAIHFYSHAYRGTESSPTRATIVENVVAAGPDTSARMYSVGLPNDMAKRAPDARLFIDKNLFVGRDPSRVLANGSGLSLLKEPEVTAPKWNLLPAGEVAAYVLHYAGTRPANRNAVDARLIDDIAHGRERIINTPDDVGGIPQTSPVRAHAEIPADPLSQTTLGMSRLAAWLCLQHFSVGGPPTPECAAGEAALRAAL